MLQKLMSNKDARYLAFLFIIVSVIRLWGIGNGLPAVYNSTEYFLAKHALSFGARHTLEPLFFIYPTLYVYILAALFGGLFVVQLLLGTVTSPADFAVQFLIDPSLFYLLGRILNSFFLVMASIILYKTLRFWQDEAGAFLLALLYSTGATLHYLGFWMIPDPLLQLGAIIVLFYMSKASRVGLSDREWTLAALVCGFTISVKYNAGFLAAGWLATVFLFYPNLKIRRLVLAAGLILSGFLLGSPYWLLSFEKFWQGFRMIWSQSEYALIAQSWPPYVWEIREILKTELIAGVILLFTLAGSLIRYRKNDLPLFLVVWPTFLLVGTWDKKGLDYFWIIYPVLILYLAKDKMIWQLERWKKAVVWLLGVAVILNLVRAGFQNIRRCNPDTRQQASEWVRQHIPTGESICYDHYHYDLNIIDLRRFSEYGAGSHLLPEAVKKRLTEYESLPNIYRFISPQKKMFFAELPDSLQRIAKGDPYLEEQLTHPHKTLEEIKNEGAMALILNSDTYRRFDRLPSELKNHPLKQIVLQKYKFYRDVIEKHQPAAVFKPDFWHGGPELRIYLFR